jgi:hypothetical protein
LRPEEGLRGLIDVIETQADPEHFCADPERGAPWETEMTSREEIKNRAYFTRRAREERQIAAICEDNAVALAHLKMADEYTKRITAIASGNTGERQST